MKTRIQNTNRQSRKSRRRALVFRACWLLATTPALLPFPTAMGATLSWNTGDGTWDGLGGLKWFPLLGGPPAAGDDVILGDRVVAADAVVTLGVNTPDLNRLDVTGGVDLLMNGHDAEAIDTTVSAAGSRLVVQNSSRFVNNDGDTEVSGGGLLLIESGGNYDAGSLTLASGGDAQLSGGELGIRSNGGNGFLEIGSGSELLGWGVVDFGDAGVIIGELLVNDGGMRTTRPLLDIGQRLELTIDMTHGGNDLNPLVNLDGVLGNGTVALADTTTLAILGTLTDDFSSTIDLSAGSILDISQPWAIDSAATIDVNALQFLTIATYARIDGGELTAKNGSTINVQKGRLEIAADFDAKSGSEIHVMDQSTLQLDGTATIRDAATIDLQHAGAQLVVGGSTEIDDVAGTFGWDGLGNADHATTEVRAGASLSIDVGQFDGGANPMQYDGTLTLDSGSVDVRVGDNSATPWVMDRNLNLNNTDGAIPVLSGNPLDVGNDSGTGDAKVSVGGAGNSRITSDLRVRSDADLEIAAGATLDLDGEVEWAGGQIGGGGTLDVGPTNTVSATTSLGVAGTNSLTVDLDEGSWLIKSGAALTVNAAAVDATDAGVDTDITIEDGASLTVQMPSNAAWRYELGDLTYQGDASIDTFLDGDPIEFQHQATIHIDGSGRSAARVDLGGNVYINDAGRQLELNGGSLSNPNRLSGGVVDGAGELTLPTGKALVGQGEVRVGVTGGGALLADDGTLQVDAPTIGLALLGTADADGVLELARPLATSSLSDALELRGGEVRGAVVVTNDAGTIRGHGRITTNTLNNYGAIHAQGGSLVIDTVNPSQLDGSNPHNGEGSLHAVDGNLEVASNASTSFSGALEIASGRSFAMTQPGSAFRNAPASEDTDGSGDAGRIEMTGGRFVAGRLEQASRLRALGPFASTLDAETVFEASSQTEIVDPAGALRLAGNATIEATATIAGMGKLVNQSGSLLTAENNAIVDVALRNEGVLSIGASPGRARTLDYQQTSSGLLEIELAGVTPGVDFDVLDLNPASGVATLDGTLAVSLLGGYVPSVGEKFEILRAPGGVLGAFASELLPTLPGGARWDVLYRPLDVTLAVLDPFPADFDVDGDVDDDDSILWQHGFGTTTGALKSDGDANGDGDADGGDFLAWQRQFGSGASSSVASAVATVPEPGALGLLAVAVLLVHFGSPVLQRTPRGDSTTRST